jgi:hypothetical protein
MMRELIEGFPQQVRDALEIFKKVQLKQEKLAMF